MPRLSIVACACAAALMSGCAQMGPVSESSGMKVAPVYRVQQPAGTAAGQYAVGRMDLAEGRIDAAIVRFGNALKLDPRFVEAHNGLGVALGLQGRFDESAEAFGAALAIDPAAAHVLSNLGFAQMKAGRLHDARHSLGQSLALDPTNARTRENVRQLAGLQRDDGPASTATGIDTAAETASKSLQVAANVADTAPAPQRPSQSETVLSRSDDSVLVRVSANVYALRHTERRAELEAARVVPLLERQGTAKPLALVVGMQEAETPAIATSSTTSVAVRSSTLPRQATSASPKQHGSRVPVSRFEVSNGAGIERLAARTATQLARSGIGISRVSNYERFDRVTTEVHYRKGFLEDARVVQKNLPVPAKLVASRNLRPDVNVRLVLGRDMVQSRIAEWYEGDDAVAATSPESGVLEDASARDVERVAMRSVAGGWRYL
ncbi:MAG: tetratricopeptide repeat protein [Burkholderiaceae bacterium]|nr:tetratricopeptide repeat protein [Burkholderiaceae bacterium]